MEVNKKIMNKLIYGEMRRSKGGGCRVGGGGKRK